MTNRDTNLLHAAGFFLRISYLKNFPPFMEA